MSENMLSKVNQKTVRPVVTVLITTLAVTLLSSCATTDRWVEHEKEMGRPFPTKYEAPLDQRREAHEQQKTQADTTALPPPREGSPEVIQPEPWKPGVEPILYGIVIKDKSIQQAGHTFVLSPYAPDKGLVDVTGFPKGTVVRDPYSQKMMMVPTQTEETKPDEQTLQDSSSDMPVVSKLPQVAPPPSIEQ